MTKSWELFVGDAASVGQEGVVGCGLPIKLSCGPPSRLVINGTTVFNINSPRNEMIKSQMSEGEAEWTDDAEQELLLAANNGGSLPKLRIQVFDAYGNKYSFMQDLRRRARAGFDDSSKSSSKKFRPCVLIYADHDENRKLRLACASDDTDCLVSDNGKGAVGEGQLTCNLNSSGSAFLDDICNPKS